MALQPGDTLLNGQYRILRQLGRGGFGFVYHAQDTHLGEQVAVKELIPALMGDEAILKRFLAEAKATMRLTHERIVRTHHVFPERGNYYIAMEYMAGGSLEERLQAQGALPVEEVIGVAAAVCEGLSYAHDRGVVHCDLKPANILFTAAGTAKVADFGIAYVSGEMLTRSWHTPVGFVAGTLPYMSPEQADGVRDDPRLDVYALGAVFYRALTGRTYLNFDQRETPGAQADNVLRIRRQAPIPPRAHNSDVPVWLDAMILKALAKRPEDRYATARQLRTALLQQRTAQTEELPSSAKVPAAADQSEIKTPTSKAGSSRVQPTFPAQRRRMPTWFWPLIAVGLIVLLVLGVRVAAPIRGGDDVKETSPSEPTPTTLAVVTARLTLQPTRTPKPPTVTAAPTSTATPAPTATPTPTSIPVPPTVTPNATGRIAFVSNRDGNYEIYAMNGDGSSQINLTNSQADDWTPAWSPDGSRVAFISERGGSQILYVMNADGTGQTRLTNHIGWDFDPSWSPDGDRIAFASNLRPFDIFVMDLDGGGMNRLTGNLRSNYLIYESPTWSPDGMQIAFAYIDDGWDIYVINVDGTEAMNLTKNPAADWTPAWSPDGVRIAFSSDRDGDYDIYVMNPDGTNVTQLTNNPALDWLPAWSPDGERIAFTSDRDGNYEIYIMNADGSEQVNLTHNRANDHRPSWSP
jgi:serine/threonine protein kinase